jgi:hypothetical protein
MAYTIEELVDFIQQDITIYGALPKVLPDQSIRQYVETQALGWFYINYINSVSAMYYYIDSSAFQSETFTNYKYIELPCEIQSISWMHKVKSLSLLQLGLNTPNLSVNLGVTNQPYLSSYVTTIGELGTYKAIIDSMSDMLDQMTLFTSKYHFNQPSHRLNILTMVNTSLIAECYVNIPNEDMFSDTYFIKYVTAWAKIQQGNLLGRYDYTLPGGVKINHTDMISQGKEELKEVIEEINGMKNNSGFFVMVKK